MIKLFNTLGRKKEIFRPIRKEWVGLYTCGPTVYNFPHIGNLRTYIFEDVLKRTLEYAGLKVRHIMNITDVEDKIIRDSVKSGKNIFEFVKPYEKAFFDDLKKLNVEKAWKYPKATAHIKEMVALIDKLLERGLAYEAGGSIYFDISKFRNYGRLGGVGSRELKNGARVDSDEYAKDSVRDFVLWKATKQGEPSWSAPFGKGRPGWHIECSAMSMKYLGNTFDLHAGGVDLIFPHHENEIAQSEGATGRPFAKFFVEGEHLLVSGEKMSKSLGNFFTLRDIEARKINPLAFRYLILTSHYRSKLNFTWESIAASQNSLNRLYDFVHGLAAQNQKSKIKNQKYISKLKNNLKSAVFDDLDTPKALAAIWKLIHEYNKDPAKYNAREILKLLYDFDKILGLNLKKIKRDKVPQKIIQLVRLREELRKRREWGAADEIRKKIREAGFELADDPGGPRIRRA